ncbi:Cruciform DNA binding protein [Knufia fluminis]|uniref:Cruciform DNA binding protein n=1 Tax=Knufia fluminis TaxID=191047 RepID=A0AAN8IC53_9EURO|nr:Cruciform DNA binding protein [Knufia fluminis]
MGSFLFRWPYPADNVYVTGTFDDWGKSEKLDKVEGGFEKEVQLSNADEKIYYKFVVDDQWIVDDNAPKEDDGHYNVNNVLLPHEIKKSGSGAAGTSSTEQKPTTRSLPQNDGASASQPEDKGATPEEVDNDVPGAFPETPANEPSSFSVAPIPATGHQNTQSSVTTSKEDYENAGGEGVASGAFGVLPINADIGRNASSSKEDYDKVGSEGADDEKVSVNPLPATGHDNTQSSVTTSKEDYENVGSEGPGEEQVSVNPLPASGHDNTQSSVTTSKEDYEKAGAFGTAGAAVAGVGATIGNALSKPKETAKNLIPESSLPMGGEKTDTMDTGPFMNSSRPGTTTAYLASKVPLEPKREAQVVEPSAPEAPQPSKEASATPFMTSSGPGTTTADLASQVPLEKNRDTGVVDDETVAEKSALEKELLQKVPETQATGEPASAARAQTSYYGLATSVPQPVEESIAKAHASPEAATETSAVAEKSAMERELQAKVPLEESAGEPAPTLSAATAETAPGDSKGDSSTAAETVDSLTGGETANEPVPDTDTSTQNQGLSAGEIAGGAAVGGAAAAGAATLAARQEDKELEPPRIDDSKKPPVTTEAAPATITDKTEPVPNTTAGLGSASPHPGVSPAAAAALSDGTEDPTIADEPSAPRTKAPAETSEATATEYAPPRAEGMAPGVSPSVAAALSDGTEDPTISEEPTLAEEPAVRMMAQNEADITSAAPADDVTMPPVATSGGPLSTDTTSVAPIYDAVTSGATTSAAPVLADTTSTLPTSAGTTSVAPVDDVTTADTTTSVASVSGTTTSAAALPPTITSADTTSDVIKSTQATPAVTETKAKDVAPTSAEDREPSPMTRPAESSAAEKTPETPKKTVAGPAAAGTTPTSAASAKAQSTTESTATGDKKKKNRLSRMFKKIFD